MSALKLLSNVTLVGPQPYESLPCWAKAFDVAIIPYRLNKQVQNANPLKLREYLATGRQIVTVSNPEIERFSKWVRIVDGNAAFLAAIDQALLPEPAGTCGKVSNAQSTMVVNAMIVPARFRNA